MRHLNPSDIEQANRIFSAIEEAWREMPLPKASEATTTVLPDSPPIEQYFANRALKNVDLFDPIILDHSPLLWGLTLIGIHYYMGAYLRLCVDIQSQARFPEPFCGNNQFIQLIQYLGGTEPTSGFPSFSQPQINCIQMVLDFIADHEEYFWMTEDWVELLADAIERWSAWT